MAIDELFSTPIGCYTGNYDLLSIEKWCYNEMQKNEGKQCSNLGGWQSNDYNGEDLKQTPLKELCDGINYASDEFGQTLGLRDRPTLVNLWVNINPKGSYNRVHIHPESRISGVFWVKSTNKEDSGTIVFMREDAYAIGTIAPIQTKYSVISASYVPLINRMLLFPSCVSHQVFPNLTDEDRISISFNLV